MKYYCCYLVKIGLVTAAIMLTLSLLWWLVVLLGDGAQIHFNSNPTSVMIGCVELWLSWGCDKVTKTSLYQGTGLDMK